MSPEDFGGRWVGVFTGTNSGSCEIEIGPAAHGVVCQLVLKDDAQGTFALHGTGVVEGNSIHLTLRARDDSYAENFGTVTVNATPGTDGTLTGTWQTSVATAGTISVARRGSEALITTPRQQETPSRESATEKYLRVPSCVVDADSLKRIHSALASGAAEAARIHFTRQPTTKQQSLEQLVPLYRVAIILRGAEGELVLSSDPEVLSSDALPKPLRSVDFDLGFYYRLANNQALAPNRALVKLDFSRTSALDLSNPSGSPTPNDSSITVYGAEPNWVAGVFERSRAILHQGRVGSGWIHRAHIYDALIYAFGFPSALAAGVLAASKIVAPATIDARPFSFAVFVFASITALWLFRFSFSIIRWLLPYVEYATAPEPLYRRVRVVVATLVLGAVASIAAAVAVSLFR